VQPPLESCLLAIRASDPEYTDSRRLNAHEHKVCSQMGEDGMGNPPR
jgi:hypothetical protein